ncbi:MAG: putative replicative helicase [Gammaproteobacteria bacterium]|nr:putative replicative helicase [Gammaproteobacteria bacterium]
MSKPTLHAVPTPPTLLERALAYQKRGLAVVPCAVGTKGPAKGLDDWQQTIYNTPEELVQQFPEGKPMNIGVMTGSVSQGLIDGDLDCMEAVRLAPYVLPPTDAVFGRPGRPDSHWLYYQEGDGGKHLTFTDEDGKSLLELRRGEGEKRLLTIFPGSVHKGTRELIEWSSEGEPARVPKGVLDIKFGMLAAYSLTVRRWVPGNRNNLCKAIVGVFLREGIAGEFIHHIIDTVVKVTGDEEADARYKIIASLTEAWRGKKGEVPGWPKLEQCTSSTFVRLFAEYLGLKQEAQVEPLPIELVQSASAFTKLELPPRECIVAGLLYSNSLAMLAAWRGVGKTMVAIDLAIAVACGRKFMEWDVPRARRALYVDGEMPAADLQDRLKKFSGGRSLDMLDVLPSEFFYAHMKAPLNLADETQQKRFLLLLEALQAADRKPELIILDNKSALASGTDENSNSEQDTFLSFLRELRHRGHTTVLVHHAGKGGDQRGASRNEDFLDLSIKLELPKPGNNDDGPMMDSDGARFLLTFTKHRGLRPTPAMLDLELMTNKDGHFEWAIKAPKKKSERLRVLEYLADNVVERQADIGENLNLKESNVSRAIKALREKELLPKKGLTLTDAGNNYVAACRRNDGEEIDA